MDADVRLRRIRVESNQLTFYFAGRTGNKDDASGSHITSDRRFAARRTVASHLLTSLRSDVLRKVPQNHHPLARHIQMHVAVVLGRIVGPWNLHPVSGEHHTGRRHLAIF